MKTRMPLKSNYTITYRKLRTTNTISVEIHNIIIKPR